MVWFERKTKHEQDCILLDWYKYANSGKGLHNWYLLPYNAIEVDNDDPIMGKMRSHRLCTLGIRKVMHIGRRRLRSTKISAGTTGIMPLHKLTGRKSHNSVKDDDDRGLALKDHFQYLLNLGKVRATRVIATLVDGVQGHANRQDTVDMVYLPISMGYRNCSRQYMARLGYNVSCKPNGAIVVEGIDGKEIDRSKYDSFSTYCNKWKKEYPQLKVSRPLEDICQYYYVFAHRHKYLANHLSADTCIELDEDGDAVTVMQPTTADAYGVDADGNDIPCADDVQGEDDDSSVSINGPECATTTIAEERELLLLESALHVSMARAQRKLYQAKMDEAKEHARSCKDHSE